MGAALPEPPPPCRKLPGGCGGAAARLSRGNDTLEACLKLPGGCGGKAVQRQEPTGNSSWRNWLFGSHWLDSKKAAPLLGGSTAPSVGGAVNGRGIPPKLAPPRIGHPDGLPSPSFRGPCQGSERSAGRAACAQCVQHTKPLVAAACLLRQRLASDAQALANRCAIVLGLSCLGSDRSLGFAVISAVSPACGADHSFEFVATASGPLQYQYKMQLTALDAVGTLPEAGGGGSHRVYWANASDLPLLRSDSLEASVTLLTASQSQLHHGVPDFRGYGAFDTCRGCALVTATITINTPANHAATTLPRCRGANPGVFAAVSSCKDLVGGRAACTGDVRQLNFDDSFKHVITPPACRFHLYSASDFTSCRRGRSVLFVGDSIMQGFYQDFGQMFGAFAPSRCRATEVRGGRGKPWLHYDDIRMPFGKGLLNLFRKQQEKVDLMARFDVVVLGSVMHDLALKTPFETYAANLRRVVTMIRQVHRKRAGVRFIWLGGTKSALEPNCSFLSWDNQLPSLVKFANRIAEQIMRQAGIETFDIYSLMSSSEPSWYYGYGAGHQVGHLAQCYGKPAINASARAAPFGGGLSRMLSQALASQVCGLW